MHRKTIEPRRLYVRIISKDLLIRLMDHQDLTVAKLAQKAGVSKATVGHLRNPSEVTGRNTTSPKTAKAIEKALGLPPCTLFTAKVESVSPSRVTTRRAA